MKTTNTYQELLPSIINVFITFMILLPFLYIFDSTIDWRLYWILIFLIYNLFCEFVLKRCIGMMVVKTRYQNEKTHFQKVIYVILYSISFTTLLFYVYFPFDLLLINMILFQLPSIFITGNTFHGLLSGNIKTITSPS